jgi:teichoic acid transport system permease protein
VPILDILWGTPWWVWAIFVYIVIVGTKLLKPTTASWQKLIIMPTIFLAWSLYSLYNKYNFAFHVFGCWLIMFAISIVLGWRFLSKHISVDKTTQLIHRPGSWIPLVFALSFFIVKYTLGVTYALHPEMRFHIFFWMIDATVSGLISGTFWGRFLHVIQCYRRNTQNTNT